MKRGLYISTVVFLVIVSLVVKGDGLNQWVNSHLSAGETLICKHVAESDLFFTAMSNDRIKTGYMLDVTGNTETPKIFIISWRFQNEKGKHIGLKTKPEIVKQGYKRSGDTIYAEEVAYREVFLEKSDQLHVTIALNKFETDSENPSDRNASEEGLEDVVQCEVIIADR